MILYFYFSLNLNLRRPVEQQSVTNRFIRQLLSKNKKNFKSFFLR